MQRTTANVIEQAREVAWSFGPGVWEDVGQLYWVRQIELWNRDEKEE